MAQERAPNSERKTMSNSLSLHPPQSMNYASVGRGISGPIRQWSARTLLGGRANAADSAGVARPSQQYGRGIPGGLSRSNAPHVRSAKVNVQRSDGRECQASELVGRRCRRNKRRDRGSDSEGVAPNHRPPSVGWRSIPPLGAIGISLDWLARKSDENKASELRRLGSKLRSLSDIIKSRTAEVHSEWPDHVRDLKPDIASAFISAKKIGLWVPGERAFQLSGASFLCEYLRLMGRLLEDGHFDEAKREALAWKPYLNKAKDD